MTINFNDITDTATPTTGNFSVGGTLTAQTEVLKGTGENLVLQSQALATSPWTAVSGATATNNTTDVTDPLGGSTASKIVSSGSFPAVYQSITLQGVIYTGSIYLRTLSGTVSARIVTSLNSSPYTVIGSSSITITSAWQRFSYTTTAPPSSTFYNFQIDQFGTNTFYAWGGQLEVGNILNTYIPTTTTAVYGTPTLSFSGVAGLGLQSDGSLYVSPAGTGALQAQATTSTATGGNARGANAVDWQTSRNAASQVASGAYSNILGGIANTAISYGSFLGGGSTNYSSGIVSFLGGGGSNTTGGNYSTLVGGGGNSALGYYNFVGGGYTNSATSGAAVTTQSGTMNGTTAVTLSGSNASIKVGQYIIGTSIAGDTYVAAISGTSLTLSKNASGSSTSTLSFYTPHGVVVGGGNNQATGSYSFIGGGGDAGTAANRNVASGDWSVVGGGTKNVANNSYTTIAGGNGNTASNAYASIAGGLSNFSSGFGSSVLGGLNNSSSGSYSATLSGAYGNTRGISDYATFSGSGYTTLGAAQAGVLVLAKQTTDATATVLTSDTAAASGINQVILPNNSAYYFRGEVVAGVTGAGDTKGWSIEGVIKRGAGVGTTALVGTPTVTSLYADTGAATWTIAVTADTTNGGLAVTFTGQAATTIRTVAKIFTTEMTY